MMGSRAETDVLTTDGFIREPLSWAYNKDDICSSSSSDNAAMHTRRASEGILIDGDAEDKKWLQSPPRRCSLGSGGRGGDAVWAHEGGSAGPHRRGYIVFGDQASCQLHFCSETDMKTETGNWIQLGQQVLKLEDQAQVPEHIEHKAHEELGETPEVRKESLHQLKCMLDKEREEHGLISPSDNDLILLSYLRAAHFNLDGAYKKMTDYYRFKQKHLDYCGNLLPQNECRAFQNNLLTVLPNRDKHGRRILVVQAGKTWDPSACSVKELVRGVMMIVKAAILEPVTQISGAIVIIDVKELGYTQMKHLISLSLAEMLVHWVQDCFPTRLKAIHVVNINALFGMVLNVFKKFLNEKFQKRVIVHNKPDTLGIEKDLLPKELGGTILELPENHGMLLHKLLCMYQDKYEQVSKCGYPKDSEKKERRGWF
ncbi:alpha-tocopherol transfer protein-like isoform X2 [Nilaparvata lugens]|nr:alpha-tocopherol transfer protein-like isoform X2 [Nilaparvata lugens]